MNNSFAERAAMVENQLVSRYITDQRVLDAMAEIPRELFLPDDRRAVAYADRAVRLSHGQTMSQPFIVAAMTQALRLTPEDTVLEIGTGSGYQTAILARLVRTVFTVERIPELCVEAQAVLAAAGVDNVSFRLGDGVHGWPEEAPFDAILVTAGAPSVPEPLKTQMRDDGGRLVIPVGPPRHQDLFRYVRNGAELVADRLMGCAFVPLIGEGAWEG